MPSNHINTTGIKSTRIVPPPKPFVAPRYTKYFGELVYGLTMKSAYGMNRVFLSSIGNMAQPVRKQVNVNTTKLLECEAIEDMEPTRVSSRGNAGVIPSPFMPRFVSNLVTVGKSFYARAFAGLSS